MTDYSVAAQGPLEDLANAVQGLAGDDAAHVARARELVKRALLTLRKGGTVAESNNPTCTSCGGPVVVKRLTKGRAAGQLSLTCSECGARTFVSTRAARAKFEARYPNLVEAPAAATAAGPATGAPAAPAAPAKRPAAPAGEDLSKVAGHRGRRLRGE